MVELSVINKPSLFYFIPNTFKKRNSDYPRLLHVNSCLKSR